MLIGEYTHTLDSKKRLSLPAKFRSELGKGLILTRGLDKCLFMFDEESWKEITRKIEKLSIGQEDSRGMARFLLAGATEIAVDGAGRILIPEYLRSFAELKSKVILTGVSNRVEIWSEIGWKAYQHRIEDDAESMAQTLGDLGIL